MRLFQKLYSHYKSDWGMEMRLRNANMTYEEAAKKAMQDEEWF